MNSFLAAALSVLLLGNTAPDDHHGIKLYAIPAPGGANIALGPDKALWFSEGGSITRIDTTGNVTQYDVPGSLSGPQGIVTGPDGALWFCGTYGAEQAERPDISPPTSRRRRVRTRAGSRSGATATVVHRAILEQDRQSHHVRPVYGVPDPTRV